VGELATKGHQRPSFKRSARRANPPPPKSGREYQNKASENWVIFNKDKDGALPWGARFSILQERIVRQNEGKEQGL
jgi:hypothetical protein